MVTMTLVAVPLRGPYTKCKPKVEAYIAILDLCALDRLPIMGPRKNVGGPELGTSWDPKSAPQVENPDHSGVVRPSPEGDHYLLRGWQMYSISVLGVL
jgi:hypothetical protein